MRTHAEWNVDTHIFCATGPTSASTRDFISSAALLVNVMARISNGLTPLIADEVGDAVGQHPGLARARAGHHQQRTLGVDDRVGLHRVEPLEQVADGVVDVPLGVDAGGRACAARRGASGAPSGPT